LQLAAERRERFLPGGAVAVDVGRVVTRALAFCFSTIRRAAM
jgi:hypothetical protein